MSGSAGITKAISRTEGSIGYVEYAFASDAGQSYLSLYGYAPLPHDLLAKVRARLGVTT
ncbi:hypothetical protein [Nonomuraea aurantiaca]|uniref:hypothetical protein n=1 Tax=Nonomuraea aurantiaca TaxID=2878562 RepID=UPI003556BEE7